MSRWCSTKKTSFWSSESSLWHHPTPGERLGNFDDREWGISIIGVTGVHAGRHGLIVRHGCSAWPGSRSRPGSRSSALRSTGDRVRWSQCCEGQRAWARSRCCCLRLVYVEGRLCRLMASTPRATAALGASVAAHSVQNCRVAESGLICGGSNWIRVGRTTASPRTSASPTSRSGSIAVRPPMDSGMRC
jgi:hypothetical protein